MENPWEQFVYPLLLNVWPENFRYWIKRLRCCFIIYNFNCFLILDCAPLKRLVSSSGDTTLSLILGVNVNSVNKFKQVVRLGGRHNMPPVTLTFDLLTLKSVCESHVTCGTPVQSFVFLGLLVFELEPMYATSDRRTDRRTDGRTPMTA